MDRTVVSIVCGLSSMVRLDTKTPDGGAEGFFLGQDQSVRRADVYYQIGMDLGRGGDFSR